MKRKIIISIALGLLGLLFSRLNLFFEVGNYQFPLTIYLIFPLLISLAYGFPYGLISYASGFFLFPFFFDAYNEPLVAKIGHTLRVASWIVFHGLWVQFRNQKHLKPTPPILVQLIYTPIQYIFIKSFSSHWGLEMVLISLFLPFLTVAITDGLLTTPLIRQWLHKKQMNPRIANSINQIIAGSLILSLVITVIVTIVHNIVHGDPTLGILHQKDPLLFKNIILLGSIFSSGGIIAKIFEKALLREMSFEDVDIKYKTLFNDLSIGVVFQNDKGQVLEANPAACEIFGLTLEQILSGTFENSEWELIDESLAPSTEPLPSMKAIQKQSKLFNKVVGFHHKLRDTHLWLEIDSWPIKLSNSNIKVISAFKDISILYKAQEALKISEGNYRRSFANSSLAFALHEIVVDKDGFPVDYKYLAVNKAFEAMTGIKQHEAVGRTIKEIHPLVENSWITQFGKVALTGESIEFEDRTNLTNRIYRVSAYQPAPRQFAVLFYDVSSFYKTQKTLRKTQKQLENKNEELENLLYMLSHDLRAPLVNLEGFNGELSVSLIAYMQNPQDKEVLQDINTAQKFILSATNRMSNIINGALKLSRITKNPLLVEKIDMNGILNDCLQVLNYQIKEKKAKVDFEPLPHCYGDHGLISQVMLNLIENSLKYSTQDEVIIKIGGYLEADKAVYFVRDYGVGVPDKHKEKIFKPFQRLVHGEIPGDGLGLPLIKRIIESMHGSIEALQPEDGESGVIFQFKLPNSHKLKQT
ncbi:MAG: PAS domain S-box protein [Fibrobacter sp.]|nr:PAS domain S-box protein [Fibrobacter sp.]